MNTFDTLAATMGAVWSQDFFDAMREHHAEIDAIQSARIGYYEYHICDVIRGKL